MKAVSIVNLPTARERRALADEYGELWEKVQAHKPTAKRYKAVADQILGWYQDSPDAEPFTESGNRFDIGVSPRAMERTISNMRKLFELLKPRKFFSLCKMALGDVDENVPIDKHPLFLVHAQTGRRELTPVKKAPAA